MARIFALATAAYRQAVRAVSRSMPANSRDELVAVFDRLQRDAFREGGWIGLGRSWFGEARSVTSIWLTSSRTAARDPGRAAGWLTASYRDVRDAFRSLTRAPGYAAVVLAMFALGIGVNTAVFTLVDALLFKALPYADADRLVLAAEWPRAGGNWTVAPTMFAHWRGAVRTLTAVEARIDMPSSSMVRPRTLPARG